MSGAGISSSRIDVRGGDAFYLVRDVLDKQLVDRTHDPMGRVDGIVMSVAEGRPPWVTCVESGITVAAHRVNRWLARCVRAVAKRWGVMHGRPVRIAWNRVVRLGVETELDLEARQTRALTWEHWLLGHVVRYIPSLKPADKKDGETEGPVTESPPTAMERVRGRRVRVQDLLGRKVVDAEGKSAGRIEELRARVRDGRCEVDRFDLGREGLLERLSVGGVSLELITLLGGRRGASAGGHHVPWEQMDLRDPVHPRLRCRVGDLESPGRE
jgi:hypothetical protein